MLGLPPYLHAEQSTRGEPRSPRMRRASRESSSSLLRLWNEDEEWRSEAVFRSILVKDSFKPGARTLEAQRELGETEDKLLRTVHRILYARLLRRFRLWHRRASMLKLLFFLSRPLVHSAIALWREKTMPRVGWAQLKALFRAHDAPREAWWRWCGLVAELARKEWASELGAGVLLRRGWLRLRRHAVAGHQVVVMVAHCAQTQRRWGWRRWASAGEAGLKKARLATIAVEVRLCAVQRAVHRWCMGTAVAAVAAKLGVMAEAACSNRLALAWRQWCADIAWHGVDTQARALIWWRAGALGRAFCSWAAWLLHEKAAALQADADEKVVLLETDKAAALQLAASGKTADHDIAATPAAADNAALQAC